MNKKLLLTLAFGAACIATTAAIASQSAKVFQAEGCQHHGNHYEAVAATKEEAGNKEFWACCECHEQFLTHPTTGSWTDLGAYPGTLDEGHIAYVAPLPESSVMTYTISNAAGHVAKLYEGETLIGTKTVAADNTVTFENLDIEKSYKMSLTVMGIELPAKTAVVDTTGKASLNFDDNFKDGIIPSVIHYSTDTDGFLDKTFTSANLTGDFAIAAKFQVNRKTDMTKEIRLGFQIKFGGVIRQQTLLVEGGKWRIQQVNTWKGRDLPANYAKALEGDGLIIALQREVSTGKLMMFFGTSVEDLAFDQEGYWVYVDDAQKGTVNEIGFCAWNDSAYEKGQYDATITPLAIAETAVRATGSSEVFYNAGHVEKGWGCRTDFSRQHQGELHHAPGENNDASWAIGTNKYDDLYVKSYGFPLGAKRQGVALKFGSKLLSIQLEITPDLHKVSWIDTNPMDYTQINPSWAGMPGYGANDWTQNMTDQIAAGTFSIGLARRGAEVIVTVNDVAVSSYVLSSAYANEKCQAVVYAHECDKTVDFTQKFAISEDVSAYGITGRRFTGTSSVTETGNDVTVNVASKENLTLTQKAYGDISAEFTVHPYAVLDNGHNNRNGFVLRFEDNKVLRYDFQYKDGNATHDFQRTGWNAIDGLGWGGICQYDMNKYETEGIRVKITRQGKTVKVYLDGALVKTDTLSEKYAANKVLFGFNSYDVTTYDNVVISSTVA